MGSRAMAMLYFSSPKAKSFTAIFLLKSGKSNHSFSLLRGGIQQCYSRRNHQITRNYSSAGKSGVEPPDVARLAETARISLTPAEVQEFGPKIKEVVNWFGQLQAIDLESIEPAIRADTEADNFRDDLPETFANRESIITALPSYEKPYVKVPKVLNKE